jgi:hypothetical protein
MDTKLIKQYGSEILSYRLRTARQKVRAQYKDFHKHLIALHKEEKALRKQKWNLGWEPLVPPVQKGWKRFFVLRDDVARSKAADFYSGILTKINTVEYSHRKDFKRKKRAFGRKKYVVREQYLLRPDEYHFQKAAFTEAEQAQFHAQYSFEKGRGKFIKRYVFNEPWRFVLRIRPNMIDKVRKQDPELDAKLKEIDTYLERNGFNKIQDRLLDFSYKWWKWAGVKKHTEMNWTKNKPLTEILNELKGNQTCKTFADGTATMEKTGWYKNQVIN